MINRKYSFDLPVHLSGLEVAGSVHVLKEEHVWEKLPEKIQEKLETASFWTGIDITKADLDSIDNKTYGIIQTLLKRSGRI